MKIQLDTNAKTIKVEESVNLGELIEAMEKLLPNWKEFKIEPTTITHFANPIIIERRAYPRYYPWWGTNDVTIGGSLPHRLSHGTGITYQAKDIPKGTFNLQIN